MQYVYVDEGQDLVMAQLAVITALCKDMQQGLVIAGDTAQTITKGVAFRFADVGALLYSLHHGTLADAYTAPAQADAPVSQQRQWAAAAGAAQIMDELDASVAVAAKSVPKRLAKSLTAAKGKGLKVQGSVLTSTAHRSSSTLSTAVAASGTRSTSSPGWLVHDAAEPVKDQLLGRALSVPCSGSQAVADQLHLTQNWRTQKHVLAVANAVTDVMYHLFPGTVDKLPPESSNVKGELPVLLLPGPQHDPLKHVFTAADAANTSSSSGAAAASLPPNLNAQTAVIVRDESSAAPVRKFVGDGALVLTVEEAKGLEYPVSVTTQMGHTFNSDLCDTYLRGTSLHLFPMEAPCRRPLGVSEVNLVLWPVWCSPTSAAVARKAVYLAGLVLLDELQVVCLRP